MTAVRAEQDGTSPHPPFGGSLAYLLLNLPLGIVWFTLLVTLVTVGVSTAPSTSSSRTARSRSTSATSS